MSDASLLSILLLVAIAIVLILLIVLLLRKPDAALERLRDNVIHSEAVALHICKHLKPRLYFDYSAK